MSCDRLCDQGRTCPARLSDGQRSCDELGVCQSRPSCPEADSHGHYDASMPPYHDAYDWISTAIVWIVILETIVICAGAVGWAVGQ